MQPLPAEDEPGYLDAQAKYEGCHHAPYELDARELAARARLAAAAAQGDEPRAAALSEQWRSLLAREAAMGYGRSADAGRLGAAARLAQAHSVRDSGSINAAIEATRALADLEDARPASGPAISTPAREELGDLLVRSHRFAEAEEGFRAALSMRPNRRRALLGLAEAAQSAGDLRAAQDAQAQLDLLRAAPQRP